MNRIRFFFVLLLSSYLIATEIHAQVIGTSDTIPPLPIVTMHRKSLLGGSFVLQVTNSSSYSLRIHFDSHGKRSEYEIPSSKTKDIGWAQGYRFMENDVYFIWAEGYDTLRGVIPTEKTNTWSIRFHRDRGYILTFSQEFLQERLPRFITIPYRLAKEKFVVITVEQIPVISFRNGSNRVHVQTPIHVNLLNGTVKATLNTTASFIPLYIPDTGQLMATDIRIDEMDMRHIPSSWLSDVKDLLNQTVFKLLSNFELQKLDGPMIDYARLLNVREIIVQNGSVIVTIL